MHNSKKGFVPLRLGKILSSYQHSKTHAEIERMREIFYASTLGSLIFAMLSTRLDIYFAMGIVSIYQSGPGEEH